MHQGFFVSVFGMKINFENIVLGIAIGDAFGAGVEFMDRDWIRAHVDFTTFVNARHLIPAPVSEPDVFTKNYSAWDYTDDTEMTIGLMKALLSEQEFSCDLLVSHWTKEYQNGYARKGYGRNGHGSMRWVFNGAKTIEKVRAFQKYTNYPGNAPAMRAVPLGFVPEDKINRYATINANATHPHPKAVAASMAIAGATHFLLRQQGDSKEVIPACLKWMADIDAETTQLLQKVDALPEPEQLTDADFAVLCGPQPIQEPLFLPGIKGVPSDAMHTTACCLHVLKHGKTTMDGLQQSIYLGGDVDSVASVCTGILAGRYGLDSLPEFMKTQVEGRDYLRSIAKEFEKWAIHFI